MNNIENLPERGQTPEPSGRVYLADGPMPATPGTLRLGTRRSRLALAQSTQVAEQIAQATGADVALITVTTQGDISRESLSQLGGTGVFVSALRQALTDGKCDLAVHSYKDLPTGPAPGITVGAVPLRADPRDAWCARANVTLAEAPPGFRVGTGSPRRAAQILARRPDLIVHDIRGNVDTRLKRIEQDLDAVVLAAAGLTRVGRPEAMTERFSLDDAPPAPGQGALAIEIRTEDLTDELLTSGLQAVEHTETRIAATAERSLLATLEAGCAAPIGACAEVRSDALILRAVVYRTDGSALLESEQQIELRGIDSAADAAAADAQAAKLGQIVARDLLARGAAELADLKSGRTGG